MMARDWEPESRHTIAEISRMPTCTGLVPTDNPKVHESVLRAYQILLRVKSWLQRGVPAEVILELIDEMENPKGGSDGAE